ncbi:penicillin-binding protein activator [Thiomicrospira sp. R3]|uniref:penicillin-binding protein activator n=1 Tax=Thiomicrospira sp. R3 TaxID=3035472 RepID=UPI00259BBDD5|nr:penicillin-binding protein activator [Thiomicrospira sp. R3]WFE67858.1 penicillin-binding protein activator [Thiomicrospira sp. R3]
MLKKLFIAFLPLLVISCSTPKAPPVHQPQEAKTAVTEPRWLVPTDTDAHVITRLRANAARKQDWPTYILLSEQLWANYSAQQQVELEQDTYLTLSQLKPALLAQLQQSNNASVVDWAWLASTKNLPALAKRDELRNLELLTENTTLKNNLLPELIEQAELQLSPPEVIAVLLPLSGRLEALGQQVRAGILKSYWQANSQSKLVFYDTAASNDIYSLYLQAKQAGAVKVIGPLTREHVQTLAQQSLTDLIALNRIDQPAGFLQLSLVPTGEVTQIIDQLNQQCARHIALLHSNQPSDITLAHQLNQAWSKQHRSPMNQQAYGANTQNLRNEMATLLNVNFSQERGNYLSRIIQKPIEHTARTRQDLDTMVLIGDERSIAVLGPQIEFFQLNLNLMGTSKLTPQQLFNQPPQRDLKHIAFPTHPASLFESPLVNNLEALGWDGYLMAHHSHKLQPSMFIHGSLGKHQLTPTHVIDTQLVWAKYEANGRLKPLKPISNNFFWTQKTTTIETSPETIRQQLLDEILQFQLELMDTSIE